MLNEILSVVPNNLVTVARESVPLILEECKRSQLLPNQVAYIIATAEHESKLGLWMEELASGRDYEGRRDLGNVQIGDGVKFKGRGYVQITGRRNYKTWGDRLGVDLINRPEIALSPDIASSILVVGMIEGAFTGVGLGEFVNQDKTDFVEARRVVNGLDKAHEIAEIAERYYRVICAPQRLEKVASFTTQASPIDLVNVAKYYQGLPHQARAIAYLQSNIPEPVLVEFARLWRIESAPNTQKVQQFAQPRITSLAHRIEAYCNLLNYKLDRGNGEINIVYCEGMNADGTLNDDKPNHFNDRRMVLTFNNGSPQIILNCEATTEPGFHYTYNPMNPKGAARIAFGQYRAWVVGTHGVADPHEALVQEGGAVTVCRDFNQDMMRTNDELDTGYFGINQHWGGDAPVNDIGLWSAGCLVGRTRQGHRDFMRIVKSDPRWNSRFVFATTIIAANDLMAKIP